MSVAPFTIDQSRKTIEIDPSFPLGHYRLGQTYVAELKGKAIKLEETYTNAFVQKANAKYK